MAKNSCPSSNASLDGMLPEIFPLISSEIPLTDRSASLLALALSNRRLCNVIIPRLLYRDVRIEGEQRATAFLTKLLCEVEVDDIQKGNLSLGHCIHILCIDWYSNSDGADHSKRFLQQLSLLFQGGGLRNLESLTLRLDDDLTREEDTNFGIDLWAEAPVQSPNLKEVRLRGLGESEKIWVSDSGVFKLQLESFGVEQNDFDASSSPNTVSLLTSFTSLRHLELQLSNSKIFDLVDACAPDGLLSMRFPHLRTLILDGFIAEQPATVRQFWEQHSRLQKVVLGPKCKEEWFAGFTADVLPNLSVLGATFYDAFNILPFVGHRLRTLTVRATFNAQALYLLRTAVPNGSLPLLRSLSIQMTTSSSSEFIKLDGNRWREDEEGRITTVSRKKAERYFDGNYLMSLTKAAPHLEELELSGTFRDSLESLTHTLSRFYALKTFVVSGPVIGRYKPFFESSGHWPQYRELDILFDSPAPYAPLSLEQAARDLAEGCDSLLTIAVRSRIGHRDPTTDFACQVIRDHDSSVVRDVIMRRTGGMVIGREEEW